MSDFKIDLTVASPETPDRPRLAVLLDGPGWARRGTVGDRDALPAEVLEQLMRWPAVERVWLPAWLRDPAPIIDRLIAAARSPEIDDDPDPVEPGPVEPGPVEPGLVELGGVEPDLSSQNVFVGWTPRPVGDRSVLDQLPRATVIGEIGGVITDIVAQEGPMHGERLARLVAQSYGLGRLTAGRASAILAAVPSEQWDAAHEFVWPADLDRATWAGFREQSTTAERPLEQICLTEIGNAMQLLLRQAAGMDADDLLRETNAIFGGSRLTSASKERLGAALAQCEAAGRIQALPDGLLTAMGTAFAAADPGGRLLGTIDLTEHGSRARPWPLADRPPR